jgi:NitT/TauT family transport system substrate-binding protein
MFKILNLLFVSVLFMGCVSNTQEPMKLEVNLWIGYAPLYYAYEKGWLRQNNIKFSNTVSLGESLKYYEKGTIDIFAGTQYEYKQAKKKTKGLEAVILLDKSNGADMILANKSINDLKRSKKIDVFFETDSVDSVLFKEFIQKYKFDMTKIHIFNATPLNTSKSKRREDSTIIITYAPYDNLLQKRGYKVVDSTKDGDLLVLDALFMSKNIRLKYKKELKALNLLIAKSLKVLKDNPKEFYKKINPYFGYKKYKDFQDDLKGIKWAYDQKVKNLSLAGFKANTLLKPIKSDKL